MSSAQTPHEPRLVRELRALLHGQRVAALGTIGAQGEPQVSMVPYAIAGAQGCIVIHVSGLAAHTRNMQVATAVSLMVMQPEMAGEPVHALPRVSLEARAEVLAPETPSWMTCREAYLARFPEAEPMTQLGDFRFVALRVSGARHVAGFGAARTVGLQELKLVLAT
jgi:putative heme iron utilization protein